MFKIVFQIDLQRVFFPAQLYRRKWGYKSRRTFYGYGWEEVVRASGTGVNVVRGANKLGERGSTIDLCVNKHSTQ